LANTRENLERLGRLIEGTKLLSPAPPILVASPKLTVELEAIIGREPRLLFQPLPIARGVLRSMIQRMVEGYVLGRENQRLAIEFQHLLDQPWQENDLARGASKKNGRSLDDELLAHERMLVTEALEKTGWIIADAARQLGVNRTTLSKRLKRLGISTADRARGHPAESIARDGEPRN
jgi:hypothetical protein